MRKIDCNILIQNITEWIKNIILNSGLSKIVIGVSGGVDSAVTASLAVRAIGKENVFLVIMPYGRFNIQAVYDARDLISEFNLPKKNTILIDIKKQVDTLINATDINTKKDFVRKGNIMARTRMIYLFDLAKKLDALVCGTENKTEYFLGYFTRFGDEASDLEPLRNLYKTQIWEMAEYLKIPKRIINKAPTAGLWTNQTDEGEFGFSYKDADKILYYYFDEKLSAEEIIKKGIIKETVVKVLERVAKNDFKHHLPYDYK